ncbi:apoptosis regulatory protein Siva [Amyelois transitella]|uniref:apoptosis regulatory protein Siva n=1 Tax=Amyelois transitella TaxID=680683 RepID=UPI00067C7AB3|nr:apoptosis regulatory protein Siva [Amyelois transitella]
MTKRSNPFIEDFVPQSKVHVGMKQFNNNNIRLQSVYEKTLELLFTGAKKSTVQNVIDNSNTTASHKRDNLKQLFIGKDGTLLHCGTITSCEATLIQCACGSGKETSCGYCEKPLCSKCQHLCASCDACYCSHCSLPGYEGAELCVSCYN